MTDRNEKSFPNYEQIIQKMNPLLIDLLKLKEFSKNIYSHPICCLLGNTNVSVRKWVVVYDSTTNAVVLHT